MSIARKWLVAGFMCGALALPALAGPLEDELLGAINQGSVEAVRGAIARGADVNARTGDNRSFLKYTEDFASMACLLDDACLDEYIQIITLLENAGAKE